MRAWLVGLLALIGGAAGAGGVDPSFAPGAVIPQQLLAVADLNGDGKPDLAVASASNDVRVLLGNGAGVFRAGRGAVSVDGGAHSGVSADFDGDGRPDLAVATSRTITVLLGDGAGGFHLAPSSPIAASGTELAAADLNGDGKTDLVLPTRANGRNTLTILLGDGSGRFAPTPGSPLEVPGRDGWSSVAVADFNRDGKPDLAGGDTESKQISILLGDGAGGFRAAATARVGTGPRALVAADFNGDRNLDLAVASTVTILLGDGAGSFRAAPGRPIASGASAIALADFNRDGRTDLAVATVSGVVVLLGEGAGRFRAVAASSFGAYADTIVPADLDGDGRPDIVAAENGSP